MNLIYEKIIIACGVLLVIIPFTGFPNSWKTIVIVLIGLAIIFIGASIFKSIRKHERLEHSETKTGTFTETT